MRILFGEHQRAVRPEEVHDLIICLEHGLTGETFDLGSEAPGIVNRTIHLGPLHLSARELPPLEASSYTGSSSLRYR